MRIGIRTEHAGHYEFGKARTSAGMKGIEKPSPE